MASTFFGLQVKISIDPDDGEEIHDYRDISKYRMSIFQEVHLLVFNGKGGYTWSEVYGEMPVFLRKFYLKQVEEHLKKENEEYEKINKNKSSSTPTIHRPNIPRAPTRR